jgi:hypothetical protein
MIELRPPRFKMDKDKDVAERLRDGDNEDFFANIRQGNQDMPWGGTIEKVGDLFVAKGNSPRLPRIRDAFSAGVSVAVESFFESEVPISLRPAVLDVFSEAPLPRKLRVGTSSAILDNFIELAYIGYNLHPELNEVAIRTRDYYIEIDEEAKLGHPAFLGIGLGAYLIDDAYENALDDKVNAVMKEENWPSDLMG